MVSGTFLLAVGLLALGLGIAHHALIGRKLDALIEATPEAEVPPLPTP